MLGQIGLPGGGFAYALGAIGITGTPPRAVPMPTLPQGRNGVSDFIPVARIADMLLHPGEPFDYNGQTLTYPDIRLVYWAGGNPFHHHQDLNRLRRAFARVDTVVVHEIGLDGDARATPTSCCPATMTLEREDIGGSPNDPLLVAMHAVAEPYGEARDDYAIFAGLAERLGIAEAFTEGRTRPAVARTSLRADARRARGAGSAAPSFDEFWAARRARCCRSSPTTAAALRAFPRRSRGRSRCRRRAARSRSSRETIAGFGYADCPGHPDLAAARRRARAPTAASRSLVANQPATRLHSQLDFGGHSPTPKHRGREVVRMHPADAAARGIADGDIVRLFNERGACLAGVR